MRRRGSSLRSASSFRSSDGIDFPATGEQEVPVAATGKVRFRSFNTVAPGGVIIPEGTVVATTSGNERFRTTEVARVGRFLQLVPSRFVDVPVIALRKGREGNVPANSVTVIRDANCGPGARRGHQGGGVNNPEPYRGRPHRPAAVHDRRRLPGRPATSFGTGCETGAGREAWPIRTSFPG